jgi:hypothetical protein
MLMICMIIPANALIYGTFLKASLASFAIFNTVSTVLVAVDWTHSRLVVDVMAIEGAGGTTGTPWASCEGGAMSLNAVPSQLGGTSR